MATRTYTRGNLNTMNPAQLAAAIDTALARSGHTVQIAGTQVSVTHAALVAGDDATINAQISAYVYDPNFGLAPEVVALKGVVPALRQWKLDADTSAASLGTAITNWVSSGTYTAAKDTVIKQTLQGLQTLTTRLGVLCDRLADVLTTQGLN